MRLILFSVFLIVSLIGAKKCNAQTGTFIWTNGAPTTNPGASGARFAVDRATFRWYEWVSGTTWVGSGDRIQSITGCSAPSYTPAIRQSWVVINNCDPNPELYAWNGTAWKLVEGGGDGGLSLPDSQIGYGTGSSVSSSSNLTYSSGVLGVNGRIELSNSSQNTNIGLAAGASTGGNTSINIGYIAGQFDTSNYSVNIGALSGRYNKGNFSIFNGLLAGEKNTGAGSIGLGTYSLRRNIGFNCISIGDGSSALKIGGNKTIAIGGEALGGSIFSEEGIYIGNRAGFWQRGRANTMVGYSANDQGFFGDFNCLYGSQASHDNYSSNRLCGFGAYSLYNIQTLFPEKGDLITGVSYMIGFVGTTNWLSIGATSDTAFHVFTYNGVAATGNGNVRDITSNADGNLGIGDHAGYFVGRGKKGVYIGDNVAYNEYYRNLSDVLVIENSNSDTALISGSFNGNKVGVNKKVKDLTHNFEVDGTVSFQNISTKDGSHTDAIYQNPTTGEIAYGDAPNFALGSGSVAFGDGTNLTEDNTNFFWDNTNKRLGIANPPSITEQITVNGSISNNFRYLYRHPSTNAVVGEFGAANNFNNGAITDMGFRTTGNILFGGTGTANSSLFIANGGNIGIGDITSNPTYPLHLKKSAKSIRMSIWADNGSGEITAPNLPGIEFQGGGGAIYGGITGVDRSANLLEGGVSIFADPDIRTPTRTSRFFVDGANGNVRIGTGITTGQTEKLLVDGDIKASGAIIPGRWTTATRPTPAANTNPIGFNTDTGKHEGWDGSAWNSFY